MKKLIMFVLLFGSCSPGPDVFRGKQRKEYREEQKRNRIPIINPLRMNI